MPESCKNRKLRILLAEDDPVIREVFHEFLENMGHQVTLAADGSQAIELFNRLTSQLDILITDICMPHVNGLELIQHVRRQRSTLPIIAMSGFSHLHLLDDIACHHIPVLNKPINFSDLENRLQAL
ncbi:MAG: response regulator [Mariprofundaceae bacterium]|nr:response regulator [Mariprofundaceae bacterium]